MPLPPPLAALRVYTPLGALPAGERARWERYARAGHGTDPTALLVAERTDALARAVSGTGDVAVEHAVVQRIDGVTFVCPSRTQLRLWQAVVSFREGVPAVLADAFVPAGLADQAESELLAWADAHGAVQAPVRTAPWSIPLAWFLLVDGSEREHVPGAAPTAAPLPAAPTGPSSVPAPTGPPAGTAGPTGPPAGTAGPAGPPAAPTLRYRTTMTLARRRGARALSVLRRTLPDGDTTEGLDDLVRWLDGFPGLCRVELDYGSLARYIDPATLAADTSAADLAEGLQALREGNTEHATACYRTVADRWRPVQLRAAAS